MQNIKQNRLKGGSGLSPGGYYWIWYVLPALAIYCLFMAYPMLDSIRLSLYEGTTSARSFVGFDNYVRLFTDPDVSKRFWGAFGNTWIFFVYHMLVQNVLGILFAVVLTNRTMRGRQLYQTIIFIPCAIAVMVSGYLFRLLLNPQFAKPTLQSWGLGFLAQPWLGRESSALHIVSLVSVWQWVGIPTMMFVAGLQGIPEDLMEAADIAGASSWQSFWYIKLPLLMPVIGMIAILTFVSNFNAFDIIYAMTGPNGPPNYSTDLIGSLFYRFGVAGEHPIGIPEPGVGAAISTSVFVMLLAGVLPTLRATQGKE